MEPRPSIGEHLYVSEHDKAELRTEINTYKEDLEAGGYPKLPFDISLKVELAEIDYDLEKYLNTPAVFSNREIKEALLDGHIRIYPYIEENLNGSSYDMTLGDWFWLTDTVHNRQLYNPHSQSDVERYFEGPYQAISNQEWCKRQHRDSYLVTPEGFYLRNIPPEALVIVLNPGERILAHTHEFIGINGPGTTMMQARSSYGRNGIVSCKDAGWGDPAYRNRWTMEIQNDNKERVPLVVGNRPAQLVFLATGLVEGGYGETGKYYRTADLPEDLVSWRPEAMLPGSYKDEYVAPIPLEAGFGVRLRNGVDDGKR